MKCRRSLSCSLALPGVLLCAPLAAQDYRLHPPLAGESDVFDLRVSPEGRSAAYLADTELDGALELHLVEVLRPATTRILEREPCIRVEFAGEGRVVYSVVLPAGPWIRSLALEDGATPLDLAPGSNFQISPDGSTVVLLTASGLFRVPSDGSAAPALVHPGAPFPVHHAFVITPDGARVLFLTEGSVGGSAGTGHLLSAPLDGSSPPVALNAAASRATVGSFVASPDGRWVVFRQGQLMGHSSGLYRAAIDVGASATRIHALLPAGSDVEIFTSFSTPHFAPDSSRVVYELDLETPGLDELYSAVLDGSAPPVKLSDASAPSVLVSRVAPDGRVVYLANQGGNAFDLHSVPVEGGAAPTRLNAPLVPGGSVLTFLVAPQGGRVAYMADQDVDERREVYAVPVAGGAPPVVLSDPVVSPDDAFATMESLAFSPDGETVVYPTFRMEGAQRRVELFAARASGTGLPIRLSGPLVAGGSVRDLEPLFESGFGGFARLAAGGRRVVLLADQEKDEVVELWASPLFERAGERASR